MTIDTKAPCIIWMNVGEMLSISIALGEAASWNDEHGFPQLAREADALRLQLRTQFEPHFKKLDAAMAEAVKKDVAA